MNVIDYQRFMPAVLRKGGLDLDRKSVMAGANVSRWCSLSPTVVSSPLPVGGGSLPGCSSDDQERSPLSERSVGSCPSTRSPFCPGSPTAFPISRVGADGRRPRMGSSRPISHGSNRHRKLGATGNYHGLPRTSAEGEPRTLIELIRGIKHLGHYLSEISPV